MAKIIRLTAKNGTIKEVPLGAKIKIDAQFVGAKVEIVEKANGAHIAAVKSHVEGEDLVLSYLDDGQEKQVRVEGAASSSEASSAPAASEAPAGEQAAAAAAPATDKDDDQSGGGMGGAGLALLGLGALGGIAAAAGGGGGGDKGGSTPPADTTAPTATITLSDTNLTVGETAVVTITFSEAVVDFSNADLDVQGGQLSTVSSSDGGKTWTGTFTPTSGLSDTTNVITLGTAYRDAAGNAGQAATSPNYVIDTLTFTVTQSGNAISFGGTATGPITITLNAQNQAVFSRSGATSTSTIDSISTKILDVPQGGTLNLVLEPGATADTFTINAPNAATINVTGNGGALNDTLAIIIESATANPDLRTMTLNTSGLTGVEAIKFIFPQDARDVVKLTANSVLTGFSTIEVSKGGVDLTAVTVVPGTEFIVNSTVILTLDQFKAMSSLVSVTGMGKLTINLTDSEVSTGALAAFLNDTSAQKPILIGAEVTIKNAAGQTIAAPAGLDAISFPGIPGLQAEIEALQASFGSLTADAPAAYDTLKEIAAKLIGLDGAVETLKALAADGGPVDSRLDSLELAVGSPAAGGNAATGIFLVLENAIRTVYAARGADTIWLTPSEDDASDDKVVYQNIFEGETLPITALTFSDSESSYREGSVLRVKVNGVTYTYTTVAGDTPATALAHFATAIDASGAVGGVIVKDNVLEIYGATPTTKLTVLTDSGTPDTIVDISNPGQKSVWSVDFSSVTYPDNRSLLGTFEFDRKVYITIGNTQVSADIVYSTPGTVDKEATILALKGAIEAKMASGQPLADTIGAVTLRANGSGDDLILVLEGKTVPLTDDAAPNFTVTAAAVDAAGEQQQTSVAFSTDNADYYAGGTLSVTVAGTTVTAAMVDGDASASVSNLVNAISRKVNGERTGSFSFSDDIEADSVFNSTNFSFASYAVSLTVGGTEYVETAYADTLDRATTVSGLVDKLNAAFSGVATFSVDGVNDKILITVLGDYPMSGGIVLYLEPGLGALFAPVVQTSRVQATLTGIEGVAKVGDTGLTLTASTEAVDPLNVAARQDFEGEYQQATILLEDASFYDYRTDGTDVPADREAKVLFAGGKINVTIAPVVDGTAGDPVTVSADMREDDADPLTWELPIGPEFGGTATIEVLYTNEANQRVATLYTNYNGANGNYSQFLAYVAEQSPYIKTLTITEGGVLTATYENGAAGTSPSVRGYYNNGGHSYIGEQIFQVVAGEILTLQGVAAAIEAAPGLAGLIADASVVDGTIVLTAANPGKETFQISDVRMDYAGVKQLASFSLETAISYSDYSSDLLLGEVQPTRTADVYFNGGKAYVTITPTDGDPVVVSADMQPGRGTIAYVRGSADFTADAIEVQFPNPVVKFSQGGDFVFNDGETIGQFLDRLSEDPRIVSARIETAGPESGNIVIETVPGVNIIEVYWFAFSDGQAPYPDNVTTEIVAGQSASAATAQVLVDAINANKALETVIESASYDAVTGQITLTALNSGAETFAISDVRLDYSGVAQLATVSLDTATAYEAYSFTDAGENTVLIRDGAEPSIYFEGGKAWLEIAQIGTEGQPVGFFAVSANMGASAEATAQALVDAINLEAGVGGDLNGLIAGATLSGSTITLQAAQAGDLTFRVGNIRLDYQGVQQIAQADFSATENADYYAGGKLRVVIDKTPDIVGDTENDVLVEANMVAGSEADSISALVTAIENSMGIVAQASAAVVEVGTAVSRDDFIFDGSGISSFKMEFFYDADGSGSGAADFYKLDLLVDGNPALILTKNATIIGAKDYFNPMNLGDVIDYLNGVAGVPVTFSVSAGGTLVMTADQAGTTEIGLKITTDSYGDVGVAVNTVATNGYFTDTGTAAQLGDLNGIISSVTQSNGVITLTSANKQQEQFSIGKAEIDYAGEKQVVTVTFDDANASYYDLANYGTDGTRSEIGVTLNGRTFTQAMFTTGDGDLTAAERTVAALEAQIEAARSETFEGAPTAFATWLNDNIGTIEIVDDGFGHLTALQFTAKNPNSADLIDLSESFTTVAPTTQQTLLDFTGINFDGDGRLTQTGQSAKVQVSIAGIPITANQTATEAGSLHNLVEQILIARDGTGTKAPGGYSEGQFLMLTSPASALLGHDIFTVSLKIDGQDVSFAVDPLALSETNGAGRATVADLGAALAFSIETSLAGYTASYDAVTGALAVSDAQSNLATVSVNSGGLAYKTYTLSGTGANATVSSVLDKVTFDGTSDIVLTAKNAGVDPLNVSTQYQMEDKTSIDGKPHIINLTFDNSTFDTAEETPIGTVIAVKIDGITAQVTIDETLSSAANRSEAIVAALKAAIIAADDAAGTGSMIGTVKQGSLNGSTLIEAGETLADGQNVLQITADRNGAHLLGRAVDGTLSIRVTAPGDVTVPLAATAGVAQIGNIVYTYQSGSDLLSDVMQGRNEGVLTFETGADSPVYKVGASTIVGETYLVPDLSTSGSDGITNTPESQTITNAGFESGDNSGFFGDQAKIGALVLGEFNGQGVLQSFVNPDGSYTATSGSSIANAAGVSSGNVTFYGDDAALGSGGVRQAFTNPDDDYSHTAGSTRTGDYDAAGGNDVYFGDDALSGPDGVKQTYTNPSSGYTAINNSPQLDGNDPGTGKLDLTGSDPGYYADEGLYTTWLNGLTPLEDNPGSNKDLYAPDVITVNDTVNEGDAASTTQVAESDIDNDKTGFAAFTWDEALQALVTQGNAGPDVIHNFQGGANGDVILLEGGLAASTLAGTLDRQAVGTPSVTYQNATAPSLTVDNLSVSRSSNTVFDFTTAGDGAFLIGRTTGHSQTTLFNYNPGTGWQEYRYTPGAAYDSPLDMATSIIEAAGFEQDPIVSYANGILTISAVGSGSFATDYQGNLSITRQVIDLPDFNLSTTEFGLVDYLDNADSSHAVGAADLDDATAVSSLLNSLFEFVATSNGEDNSTIFAVTASDDSSVTAIWAHKQSSDTDSTVDPLELTLLAMVNTVDAQFAMSNFDIHQAAPPL